MKRVFIAAGVVALVAAFSYAAVEGVVGDGTPDMIYNPATGNITIDLTGMTDWCNAINLNAGTYAFFTGDTPLFPATTWPFPNKDTHTQIGWISGGYSEDLAAGSIWDFGNIAGLGIPKSVLEASTFTIGFANRSGGETLGNFIYLMAHAQQTWSNGAGDGLWASSTNWTPSGTPAGSTDVILPTGLGRSITLGTGAVAKSLLVNAGSGSAYTLTGGAIAIGDGTTTAASATPADGTARVRVEAGNLASSLAAGKVSFADNAISVGATGSGANGAVAYALEFEGLTNVPSDSSVSLSDQARVDLAGSQTGLNGVTYSVNGAVLEFDSAAALGNSSSTMLVRGGGRWMEEAVYTAAGRLSMIQYTGVATGSVTVPVKLAGVGGDATSLYVDIRDAGELRLSGDVVQAAAGEGPITLVSADTTSGTAGKLVLPAGSAYTFAVGVSASGADVDIKRANRAPSLVDDVSMSTAVLSGPRNAPDSNVAARTVRLFDSSAGGVNAYYFGQVASEAAVVRSAAAGRDPITQGPNAALSTKLVVQVDPAATLQIDGINHGGAYLKVYDDLTLTGGGKLNFAISGVAGATEQCALGAGFTFSVAGGSTLAFTERKNTSGAYYANASATSSFFDGGSDNNFASGEIRYSFAPGTGLEFYANDIGIDRTMRFDTTVNSGGNSSSVTTWKVDASPDATGGTLGKMVVTAGFAGNAGRRAAPTTAVMNWTGKLVKTGVGELVLDGNGRTYAINAGASLDVAGGTVTLTGAMGAMSPGAGTPTVANLDLTVTQGKVVLGADQALAKLDVQKVNAGDQGLDLDGRAVRVFAASGVMAVQEQAIRLMIAASGTVDGIYDSTAAGDMAVGWTDQRSDADGRQYIVLAATYGGDANMDGRVSGGDASILLSNWGLESGALWDMGDFNLDGRVSGGDASVLLANWGKDLGYTLGSIGDVEMSLKSIPEPASMALLGIGGLLALRRRRRR